MPWIFTPRERPALSDEQRTGDPDVFRGFAFGVPLALFGWLLIVLALLGTL
jgi:hypothetical protein